jgi:hypothetical protein
LVDVRIEERDAIATAVAIVPDASHWREGLDRVWAVVGGLSPGRNVMRHGERVEVGVELDGVADGLIASELPGGPTAVGLRVGELSPEGIAEAHEAVRAWCASHGHALTGECWEIYGHMNDQPFELLVGWPLSGR